MSKTCRVRAIRAIDATIPTLATLPMCCEQIRRDRGVRGILTLLGLSLLGQRNIDVRNLRGYLVMLCQTMKMLRDSLWTYAWTLFICFIFVSMRRGSTAVMISFSGVPRYYTTDEHRITIGNRLYIPTTWNHPPGIQDRSFIVAFLSILWSWKDRQGGGGQKSKASDELPRWVRMYISYELLRSNTTSPWVLVIDWFTYN